MEKSLQNKPESESSTTPMNYVVEWMRKKKIPLTKENYLQIEYLGQEIPPEAEHDLPPEIFREDELRAPAK